MGFLGCFRVLGFRALGIFLGVFYRVLGFRALWLSGSRVLGVDIPQTGPLFRAIYCFFIIRNPQNPILIIKASTLGVEIPYKGPLNPKPQTPNPKTLNPKPETP